MTSRTVTTPRIDLVYFEGCPHTETARTNLSRALDALSLPAEWEEWSQGGAEIPDWASGYPSPTVLVNGNDVAGFSGEAEGRCCAVGGAPSPKLIRDALTGQGRA